MFIVLDPSIDCFTTDVAPTILYANAHLGIAHLGIAHLGTALESKGCNCAASPTFIYPNSWGIS